MRAFPLLLAALALTSCFRPKGECHDSRDCMAGTHCSDGLCLSDEGVADLGEACGAEQDCLACCTCSAGACALLPDRCRTGTDCEEWATCSGYTCVPRAGRCASGADCQEWKQCVDHSCTLAPGRCDANADCAAWQYCEVATHRCTDVGAACPDGAGCTAWQECTDGHCANQAGRCARTAECDPSWQVCQPEQHTCLPAAGRCASSQDCIPSYQACAATHYCTLLPGRCATAADCEPWEECLGHACLLRPGRCADDTGCAAAECCASDHACGPLAEELGNPGACRGQAYTGTSRPALFQTFVAGTLPVLQAVTLRLSRDTSVAQPTLSLHRVGADHLPGEQLTSQSLSLDGPLEQVRVPLVFKGLVAGVEYAVVLSQSRSTSHVWYGVGWCTTANTLGSFGNRSEAGAWNLNLWSEQGWMQVHTTCR